MSIIKQHLTKIGDISDIFNNEMKMETIKTITEISRIRQEHANKPSQAHVSLSISRNRYSLFQAGSLLSRVGAEVRVVLFRYEASLSSTST